MVDRFPGDEEAAENVLDGECPPGEGGSGRRRRLRLRWRLRGRRRRRRLLLLRLDGRDLDVGELGDRAQERRPPLRLLRRALGRRGRRGRRPRTESV